MTNSEFIKLAKSNNKKLSNEIKTMQTGITEGKNNNKLMVRLISESTKQ